MKFIQFTHMSKNMNFNLFLKMLNLDYTTKPIYIHLYTYIYTNNLHNVFLFFSISRIKFYSTVSPFKLYPQTTCFIRILFALL